MHPFLVKHLASVEAKFNIKCYDYQIPILAQIIEALEQNKREIILSAPTGTGKSIIGVVASELCKLWLKEHGSQDEKEFGTYRSAVISIGTNALVEQYVKTFNGHPDFIAIKGAGQYECAVTNGTAEGCINAELKKIDEAGMIQTHCNPCEFKRTRALRNQKDFLITNYSYTFLDRLYSARPLEPRAVYVWDEVHTLNDAFVEHCAVVFSAARLEKYRAEVQATLKLADVETMQQLKEIHLAVENLKINDANYMEWVKKLGDLYKNISAGYKDQADNLLRRGMKSFDDYNKFIKLHRKYEGLFCKIDDFLGFNYEHVFDANDEIKEISIKPIFVSKMMFDELRNSAINIFMSATVNEEMLSHSLGLEKSRTAFIKVAPIFPAEHKKVVFYRSQNLSFKTMSDPTVIKQLQDACVDIVKLHVGQGQRGIVLASSFKINKLVAEALRKSNIKGVKIFEHEQGQKLVDILASFKNYNGVALLLSPSIFEGIDLPGDQSQYQIITKAPYPSLADKRMKFILNHYPAVYNTITCMKLIQGIGRSVRSMSDQATTYMLDSNIKRTFSDRINIWKDEYVVNHASILS